ncbi:hypothetical protein AM501_07120 [Aneurinibacillus migulanus]|uniref:Uncharacterized protein n=1 Tax=Aneurinibacillus migulanus TaxID=47500 RepID=A0A0D1XNJ9_ANEMI|nr:hypothetical protein [Aneurinibacillus migulanus]KIV53758.1 hypothetical protein TS64_17675 [Aneurinibacillus migulanus]KIV58711.1 hypothetical protein TS65_04890 [Aneurinibacillus migulanus]KON96403.1 hypothetical protein AF333_13880 [Aneurinibacillus migulanus]KPD08881.1 hypothetical protein AM501_07120 [Aneurinibacillus migulanus]MCP1356859.1 hypothetical protein [Aneurinibacillus migulanus]
MIQVKLQPACSSIMYFDAVKGGRTSFSLESDVLIGQLSREEFTSFLKDNNLVPYHDALKSYESGEIVGRFESVE